MGKGLMKAIAVTGSLYAARRYFSNWGTTKAESTMALRGDQMVGSPLVQTTEGVWIDAPAADVWPWLVQLGQDRGGLYSFEPLENLIGLHYLNADRVHPEWQQLSPGDAVRLVPTGWMGLRDGLSMRVVDVDVEQCIVLRVAAPGTGWDAVWSIHLIPRWDDRCRLLIRSRVGLRHPGQVLLAELARPLRAFVIRGTLIGIRRRVHSALQAEASAAKAVRSLDQASPTGDKVRIEGTVVESASTQGEQS